MVYFCVDHLRAEPGSTSKPSSRAPKISIDRSCNARTAVMKSWLIHETVPEPQIAYPFKDLHKETILRIPRMAGFLGSG